MAYDEYLAERIRQYFTQQKLNFYDKAMIGGRVFMLNDKMCCGIHFDKKRQMDLLMARIGVTAAKELKHKKGCHPMDFTGRPMKGYVFIDPEGFDLDEDLLFWLNHCITFNPMANAAKKRNEIIPYPIESC